MLPKKRWNKKAEALAISHLEIRRLAKIGRSIKARMLGLPNRLVGPEVDAADGNKEEVAPTGRENSAAPSYERA
jgi:hypothetical protein